MFAEVQYVLRIRAYCTFANDRYQAVSEVHRLKNRRNHSNREYIRRLTVAVGMVFVLAGCGQDESVQTGAEVQTGQTDTANTAVEPSETNASRAQMEIDEETRNELTAQLLEENNLDTSGMESRRTTNGCTFELPAGFEESEDAAGMYVTGRYPIDASTIYYVVMDQDVSMQLLTEETFKEQAQADLREAYGEDIEVTVDSFESIEVSGYPAFRIMCHYQVNQIRITQLEYAINADKSYMITYSQTDDYDRMEEYEASAATIRIQ